jgi:hypothetical protein
VSTHEQAGWYVLLHPTPQQAVTRPDYEIIGPFRSRLVALTHARREAARDRAVMARLYAEGKPDPRTAWHDAVPIGPP